MYRVLQFGMTPRYGGVEAFIMNLYRGMDRSVVQFDFWVTTDEKISYQDEIEAMGGRIIRQKYYSRKKSPVKHWKEIFSYFKENRDVVAIHLHKAMIRDIDLLIAAGLCKIPVRIIHSHIASNPKGLQPVEKFNCMLVPFWATELLACSKNAGAYMFGSAKFEIIRDGVDIPKYVFNSKLRKMIRKKYELSDNVLVIGSVGRFSGQKNTVFMIDIFAEIYKRQPQSRLLLIGEGPDKEQVVARIKSFQLENAVILPGEITNVSEAYSAMDIFLFPSRYEGFGMVLLEAQINGLPCVAAGDGIPQLVNVTGRVEFLSLGKSAAQWAEAVLNHCKDARYYETDRIRNMGFDSQKIASIMQKKYLENYRK